jgi:hypothetical protein
MCIACEQFDGWTFVAFNSEKLNTERTENLREQQRNLALLFALHFLSIWVSVSFVAFLRVLYVKFCPLFALPCTARKIIQPW